MNGVGFLRNSISKKQCVANRSLSALRFLHQRYPDRDNYTLMCVVSFIRNLLSSLSCGEYFCFCASRSERGYVFPRSTIRVYFLFPVIAKVCVNCRH